MSIFFIDFYLFIFIEDAYLIFFIEHGFLLIEDGFLFFKKMDIFF